MTRTADQLAEAYFTAWDAKDFDTLATLLADDVSFVGPMATVQGVEDCIAGLRGMSQIMDGVAVLKRLADAEDAITVFELRTSVAGPVVGSNWSHVEDGRITRIRVSFDPRPLLGDR